ncbi:hypothetical protein N0V94_003400 [Neodidymelliopsis sp. IMI 364377]|nr:hypothetical protein N0V94_003400 [Neodidymelliopsis sp. IMI 364377]
MRPSTFLLTIGTLLTAASAISTSNPPSSPLGSISKSRVTTNLAARDSLVIDDDSAHVAMDAISHAIRDASSRVSTTSQGEKKGGMSRGSAKSERRIAGASVHRRNAKKEEGDVRRSGMAKARRQRTGAATLQKRESKFLSPKST